jgi:hypothetical protein
VVVDPLEVVDVHEAERQRPAAAKRVLELAGKAFVEVAVVAETRERIGEREPDGPQRPQQRTLVELDREQRDPRGPGQQGRSLPRAPQVSEPRSPSA